MTDQFVSFHCPISYMSTWAFLAALPNVTIPHLHLRYCKQHHYTWGGDPGTRRGLPGVETRVQGGAYLGWRPGYKAGPTWGGDPGTRRGLPSVSDLWVEQKRMATMSCLVKIPNLQETGQYAELHHLIDFLGEKNSRACNDECQEEKCTLTENYCKEDSKVNNQWKDQSLNCNLPMRITFIVLTAEIWLWESANKR